MDPQLISSSFTGVCNARNDGMSVISVTYSMSLVPYDDA